LALQTSIGFGFMVVIDDGLSWAGTCRKLDPSSRPILVSSNGNQSFNLFDTRGLPLSSRHLANATALSHLLVGRSLDEDKDKLRAALLAETSQVYGTAYRAWRKDNPESHCRLCWEAAVLLKFQQARDEPSEGFLDAFLEARGLRKGNPKALKEFEDQIDEGAALALDRDPLTEHFVRNLAFANWTPEMFPTLSDLQDELHTAGFAKGPHRELCATLASLLRPWLRDGRYGPIVDGASNVHLGSFEISNEDPLKVVHFELGEIGKSEAELKAVVGFLITNEVRNHIEGMPRGIRKQVVIEEMTSFLRIPHGEEIVIDFYERGMARRRSCQLPREELPFLCQAHRGCGHSRSQLFASEMGQPGSTLAAASAHDVYPVRLRIGGSETADRYSKATSRSAPLHNESHSQPRAVAC